MDYNHVQFAGHIGKDPETKVFDKKDGSKGYITTFSLAVNNGYGNKKETIWVNCRCFDQMAASFSKYAGKGKNIFVEGRAISQDYVRQDGTKIYKPFAVLVERWFFCESKKAEASDAAGGSGEESAPIADKGDKFMEIPDGIDEELPFV